MNVARSLELSAFYFPDRVALIFKDRRWTYRELDIEASALASDRFHSTTQREALGHPR